MTEIWKPVLSYPGILASSEGNILLPPGYAPLPNGGYRTYLPSPTNGVVKRSKKNASHVYRGLWVKRYGNLKIHQLVCEAFHGARPSDKSVVMHIDEDGLNNRPSNLKWGTQKENMNMPILKAYHHSRKGGASPRSIWKQNRDAA